MTMNIIQQSTTSKTVDMSPLETSSSEIITINASGSQTSLVSYHHQQQQQEEGDSLIKRFGGAAHFEFLNMSFCERIKAEERLKLFFGSYGIEELEDLYRELLLATFLDKNVIGNYQHCIAFRFHRFFLIGLNESHFDILETHFLDALLDCWVDEDVYGLCKTYFAELRPIFKENARQQEIQENKEETKKLMTEPLKAKDCPLCKPLQSYASLMEAERVDAKKGAKANLSIRYRSRFTKMFGSKGNFFKNRIK